MSQIWRKSNWKTSYVIKLYADGVGAPEVDGDAVLVRNHYRSICGLLFLRENMVESYTRGVGKCGLFRQLTFTIPGIHGMMEHMWNFTER